MRMKKSIRMIFALMLAAVIVFCTSIPAFATVSPTKTNAYAGQIVTLKYNYSGIAGINGTFTYSNSNVFSNVKFQIDGLVLGEYNASKNTFAYFGTNEVNCTITLKLTVSSGVKIGDKCTVTLKYETTGADGMAPSVPDYKYDTATITVVEKIDSSALRSLIEQAEGLKKSLYTTNTWANLETALNNAKSALNNATTQSEINVAAQSLRDAINNLEKLPNYTELEKQIKIAEALKKEDYTDKTWGVLSVALEAAKTARNYKNQTDIDTATKNLKNAIAGLVSIYEGKLKFDELNRQIAIAEGLSENDYDVKSWDVLKTALAKAKTAKSSKNQPEIDSAAAELKSAIEGLVKINYNRLSSALQAIDDYIKSNKFLNLWNESQGLMQDAKDALTSRDQQKVDDYSQKLENLLIQLKKAVADMAGTDSIIIEKPIVGDDYCNVKTHPIWIILLWISFAANLVFAALIVMYFYTKKKKTTDDTPLVDYDISDDAE